MCLHTHVCVSVYLWESVEGTVWLPPGGNGWLRDRGEEETDYSRSLYAFCPVCLSYPFFKIKCKQSMGRALKGIPGKECDEGDCWCAEGIAE